MERIPGVGSTLGRYRLLDLLGRGGMGWCSGLAASTEHPGIVPIYEAGEIDGLLFIAMRYVDGPDLAELLRAEGALDPERAVDLVGQLADALDAAHARGLVHRDVKPSNALIDGNRVQELCGRVFRRSSTRRCWRSRASRSSAMQPTAMRRRAGRAVPAADRSSGPVNFFGLDDPRHWLACLVSGWTGSPAGSRWARS